MNLEPMLTAETLAALCQRTFPNHTNQHIEAVLPFNSRQHEVVAFQLSFQMMGVDHSDMLLARRYISTVSWWRHDDRGKAQRETTLTHWLYDEGFPVPYVYTREIGMLGDIVLYSFLEGLDWSVSGRPFQEVVEPYVSEFARLLAKLHSYTPPQKVLSVVPTVTLPGSLANLTALAQRINQPELQKIVAEVMLRSFDLAETQPVLLHGDYHFSNALLRDEKIIGIIDWEYCAYGDPRWDVANAYMQLVDFDAAGAAQTFLETYLHYSGRSFEGPPLYNIVTALQQWAISEWLVQLDTEGQLPGFAMAHDLITLRDTHYNRTRMALQWLD